MNTSWKTLLAEKRVAAEPTSKKELDELRAMAAINLQDAKVGQISAQGRYEFAYNAGRLMAAIAIRVCGYRLITKSGHHYFTFQALQAADPMFEVVARYFNQARKNRNDFSYDSPLAISDTDAEDLLLTVIQFIADVEAWIAARDPTLS